LNKPALPGGGAVPECISEDDLQAFEAWLKYQAVDAATVTSEELAQWRGIFDEAMKRAAATPKSE
jgi:hypothetical protein